MGEKPTVKTPDIDEISRPKRPPPIHANDPTMYCEEDWLAIDEKYQVVRTYGVGRNGCIVLQRRKVNDGKKTGNPNRLPLCPLWLVAFCKRGESVWKMRDRQYFIKFLCLPHGGPGEESWGSIYWWCDPGEWILAYLSAFQRNSKFLPFAVWGKGQDPINNVMPRLRTRVILVKPGLWFYICPRKITRLQSMQVLSRVFPMGQRFQITDIERRSFLSYSYFLQNFDFDCHIQYQHGQGVFRVYSWFVWNH